MKVLDPGHSYELDRLDVNSALFDTAQIIDFVKRIGEKYPGNTGEPHSGTTVQELMRVVINRLQYTDAQKECEENHHCILHARMIIYYLEKRAYREHGVELDQDMKAIELVPTNSKGHLWKE